MTHRAAIAIAVLWFVGLVGGIGDAVPTAYAGSDPSCGKPADMLSKGLDAYDVSRYELAIPSFECVLTSGNDLQKLHANFYLARIFGDDTGGFTDHEHAYRIYRDISDAVDTVDPDDMRRAPFVAKALTSFAGYVKHGIPEIGLKPDMARTVEYIQYAATFFNEPDAQFELAKMHLTGEGVPSDEKLGLHYLQKLSQDGYAGAQAYMAELSWKGSHMRKDHVRALALIKTAVGNAPASEKLWIEDSYQTIYCDSKADDRVRAAMLAEVFHKTYGHSLSASRAVPQSANTVGRRDPLTARQCSNGERVDMELHGANSSARDIAAPALSTSIVQSTPSQVRPAGVISTTR